MGGRTGRFDNTAGGGGRKGGPGHHPAGSRGGDFFFGARVNGIWKKSSARARGRVPYLLSIFFTQRREVGRRNKGHHGGVGPGRVIKNGPGAISRAGGRPGDYFGRRGGEGKGGP